MSWSNWIYLLVGIGLGLGSRWLFRSNSVNGSGPSQINLEASSQTANQDLCLSTLKQTQIAYELAHEISSFKAGFLARISHELRSPLNSLIGLHQLILSDLCDDPAEEREFVAQANSSALKLMHLIDEILAVARIEHGTNQLEIQPLQLASVLTEVYSLTHLLAADRNIRFQLSPPSSEIYILADPRWLRQVLVSLLDKCFIQMHEGSVFITAQSTPAEVVQIWLDVQLPTNTWFEPIDLMKSGSPSEWVSSNVTSSLGLALLLNQTLLELMHGSLELVWLPTLDESSCTRMQITIPLLIPETASLEQEESQ